MARDVSPEERLLRLIRSKTPKAMSAEGQKEAVPAPIPKAERPSSKPSAMPAPARPSVGRKARRSINILRAESLNLILIILLAGLSMYFIPLFLKRPKDIVQNLEERIKSQEKSTKQAEEGLTSPPFSYFSEQVGARNIFSPVAKEENASQATVEEGPKLEDIKAQFNLLGVIGGESPQAIIEDKKTQKSYFLNKGSTFDDIQVKDILDDKVILIYKGQEFELVL